MNILTSIYTFFFLSLVTCQSLIASDHPIPSRLIIGFHDDAYMSLGGAQEAINYINKQWGDKNLVSLVRPMGNSTILVEVINSGAPIFAEIIQRLMRLEKIKYVNEDQPVNHFPATDITIPTLQ